MALCGTVKHGSVARECNSQAVANTLWAYARMGRRPVERVLDALTRGWRRFELLSLTEKRERDHRKSDRAIYLRFKKDGASWQTIKLTFLRPNTMLFLITAPHER